MKYIIILILIVFGPVMMAQDIETMGFLNSGVDAVPENYGGKQELNRFIDFHMQYPGMALKKKIEGDVDIKYICTENGTIHSYSIISNTDKELNKEAVRLFKMLLFHPAVNQDKKVAYEHHIVIPFRIPRYKKSLKRRDKGAINPHNLPADTSGAIYTKVEKQPSFLHGNDSLTSYVYSELEYPQEAETKGIEGTVMLSFVVEPDGFLSNIDVIKSVGGGCTEEALRVIGQTKWNPGQLDKKLVRCSTTYSVVFKLKGTLRDNTQGTQRIGGY